VAHATVSEDREVAPFRITKYPITVGRYRQCMAASACEAPALSSRECAPKRERPQGVTLSGPTIDKVEPDDLPIVCLKYEQATSYCRWLGSKLPDSTQWLAAARGPAIRRYPWGDRLNGCEQHPLAHVAGKPCDLLGFESLRVGIHPSGASPSGVEDVLLPPAEIVATSPDAWASVCRFPGPACLIRGNGPGAIDDFGSIWERSTEDGQPSGRVFGFRCVLEGT
jgi:hypothetical protein